MTEHDERKALGKTMADNYAVYRRVSRAVTDKEWAKAFDAPSTNMSTSLATTIPLPRLRALVATALMEVKDE